MWTVSPRIKDRAAAESLMLALGKALHLVCEFEGKCQYVLRVLNIAEMFEAAGEARATFAAAAAAKDAMLCKTIKTMQKIDSITAGEIDLLTKAREARNYIAHKGGQVGSLEYLEAEQVAEAFAVLRPAVIHLAKGDNVISIWAFEIQEKLAAPEWMTQTYEVRVLHWIFGDPFDGPSSWDEWVLADRWKRWE